MEGNTRENKTKILKCRLCISRSEGLSNLHLVCPVSEKCLAFDEKFLHVTNVLICIGQCWIALGLK